jgi:glutathione synthase/RimK-type ligase-like ATP-grasp enzyme
MATRIAIHRDRKIHKNGEVQSYSDRWRVVARNKGAEVKIVDAFAPDFFDRLNGCDGFMWRFGYAARQRLFARRLLPAVEHGLGIPVFPSWKTAWHFEDKIGQNYLLQAAKIPTPRTWVFWYLEAAIDFCSRASYPLVLKLAIGFQSANVRLLNDPDEATNWARLMFGPGTTSLAQTFSAGRRSALRRVHDAARALSGRTVVEKYKKAELQQGYFFVQEFLPANEFDTRVTIIGNRAFAFRRFNRPNDFRASGSGKINWDPADIDLETVRLAFQVAQQLGTQSLAVDALRRAEDRLIIEISYTYASWAVRDCPGHWVLHGDPQRGELEWVAGHLSSEDAILEDFLAVIRRSAPKSSKRSHALYAASSRS